MPHPFVAQQLCAVCRVQASRVELVAPGGRPAEWAEWSLQRRERHAEAVALQSAWNRWWMIFEGVTAGNGLGDSVAEERAERLSDAFEPPLSYERVHQAGFYDDAGMCGSCDVAYCIDHWQTTASGYGTCPRGHGKSLDPFWSASITDDD